MSTLEITRVLPAARPDVFRAFSAADELAKWWGPEGFSVSSLEFSPRVGERYRIEMQPPEGEDPDPDDVENLVELSFRDLGESTEITFTQGPFKTEPRLELHRDGWTDTFDRLARHIRKELT
jgi:uncharacterized protein YndB with AHSA1/START domain